MTHIDQVRICACELRAPEYRRDVSLVCVAIYSLRLAYWRCPPKLFLTINGIQSGIRYLLRRTASSPAGMRIALYVIG
jgi:hypothetical protein